MARQCAQCNGYTETGANFRRATGTGRPPPKNTDERKGGREAGEQSQEQQQFKIAQDANNMDVSSHWGRLMTPA